MEFVMTGLQIELQDAIKKIVSISERVKENTELGKDMTYMFFAVESDGMTATVGASKKEIVKMLFTVAEEDGSFKECIMTAAALIRMKSSMFGVLGGIEGSLVDLIEFLTKNRDKTEEGSEGDAETV